MHEFNTPPATRGEQERVRQAAEHIGELAVLLRMTNQCIAALDQNIGDIWPVLPQNGPDSLTGDQLYPDLIAWRWVIDHAEDLLHAHFTHEVQRALVNAGLEDDDEDDDQDDDQDDDDGPSDVPDAPECEEADEFAEAFQYN